MEKNNLAGSLGETIRGELRKVNMVLRDVCTEVKTINGRVILTNAIFKEGWDRRHGEHSNGQ